MNFAAFSGKREFSANAGKSPLVGGIRMVPRRDNPANSARERVEAEHPALA